MIVKVEGLLCSGFFGPESSLWTVVRSLVAAETLALADHVPAVIGEDEEYSGLEQLQQNRLSGVVEGRRAVFRFKVVQLKRSVSKKSLLEEESLSKYDVLSTRTTGLESSSSRSTPDDRYVSFKKGEELLELISQDLELEDSAERARTTAYSARLHPISCCTLF